ncbi:efflux RND transporter periplasmic adaptor subunit [Gluconacetobacter entanii]|uniref:Efflux RND transporter periplasmic adaptor subunit n=1 Tax=Gluconacetobacter entanii TaxID=108528 RepID=A0ABT3K9P7_9PROT|nr:efflux RND transporter periplasmic adaptor subunit [Gluconacetobacter entanii]MCE2577718.1 efflux RND transporter periplasmic adaptor subunit [Komagataeibacter sp. FNDCR1]MBY4641663.1 efflux RND transporter periplasmic adaptor subunit [Gluconacetobacter entanii]MCW4581134.1 efflux RND transporter periplasmic adaptor subunit [Gluconacetobacter entanii]MCW4584394.1 efflux RND transporter periplasmic adaptor subunit [Gluconacetobacter entanii]MCW4587808.1 efflux RND transporter periplasmic ada
MLRETDCKGKVKIVKSHYYFQAIAPVAVLLALAGCNRKAAPPAMPPQQVSVVTLRAQPVEIHTSLPGRTEAFEIAQVRPQVSGVIEQRLFTEGTDVKAGQQLYQIYAAPYQAAYDSAKGQLVRAQAAEMTARAKLTRYGQLVRAHAVSQQDYDDALAAEKEAQGEILTAQGQVERAAVDLGYTKMNAPISGRIGRSILTVGALAIANQSNNVAIVTRLDPIYVDVNLPATELLRFRRELAQGRLQREGDNAASISLQLEDGTTYEHAGRMEFSEVNVDEATATVVVRAIMPNPDKLLLPGMYVHAQLTEGTDPQALLVPQEAVSRNSHGDPQAWVVDQDNKVNLRQIQTSQAIGTNWLVTDGLKSGERVVTVGVQKIHPGATVTPVEAQPAGKAG